MGERPSFYTEDAIPKEYSAADEAKAILNQESSQEGQRRFHDVNQQLDKSQGKFREGLKNTAMAGLSGAVAGVLLLPAQWQGIMEVQKDLIAQGNTTEAALGFTLLAGAAIAPVVFGAIGIPRLIKGFREMKQNETKQKDALNQMRYGPQEEGESYGNN